MDFLSIPTDLLAQFCTFDERCTFLVERIGQPPRWRVTLQRDNEAIVGQEIDLGDALDDVIREARARGWK